MLAWHMSRNNDLPVRTMQARLFAASLRACLLGSLVALAALLVAGCGSSETTTMNVVPAEHAIANSILVKHGVHTAVVCPSDVPKKAGQTFTCTAHLAVGAYPVTVVETNDSGHIRYESKQPLIALNTGKVERAIEASIANQRRLRATVSCPAGVLQQSGLTFTCTALVKGKSYTFEVTETDNNGHVRYVGR